MLSPSPHAQGFKSEEEKKKYFEDLGDPLAHPMFASSMEEMEGHPLVEALRALKEEDKNNMQLAEMYKEEGNDMLRRKTPKDCKSAFDRYSVAIGFAEKALAEADTADLGEVYKMLSALHSNRALASLNAKNYRSTCADADKALGYQSGNIKAHFRKSKALLGLHRYLEAKRAICEGLAHDPESTDLIKLQQQCEEELVRVEALRVKREQERAELASVLNTAWTIGKKYDAHFGMPLPGPFPSQFADVVYPTRVPLDNSDDKGGSKSRRPAFAQFTDVWPLLLLYPEHNQIDIMHTVSPDSMLVEVLSQAFAEPGEGECAPWDIRSEYFLSRLVVYAPIGQAEPAASSGEWVSAMTSKLLPHAAGEDDKAPENTTTASTAMDSAISTSVNGLESRKRRAVAVGWAEVHFGCTIKQLLYTRNHILDGALLKLTVFVRDNAAHRSFLEKSQREGVAFSVLNPK
jgi:translocation protein SEC72